MVFASFFVPLIIILLLMVFVNNGKRVDSSAASDQLIKPVGQLNFKDASAPRVLQTGEQVYKAVCASCHTSGAAGAPKFGDIGAWSARLKTGYEALLNSALKGKNAMGAQGGGDFDDFEIARAVVYMANGSGGKFAEPAKAAVASPAP